MNRFAPVLASFALASLAPAQNFVKIPDVTYGTYVDANNQVVELKLDVYKPTAGNGPFPCIVWIHGGGWSSGSKNAIDPSIVNFTSRGYVVTSVNYRLVQQGQWPAQINDCRGAIRFLRANAAVYDIDPSRMASWGNSAGGHLSLMVATSSGQNEYREGSLVVDLEGTIGGNLGQSSAVQACINYFGPAELLTLGDFDRGFDNDEPGSGASRLVGGPLQERPDWARSASPVSFVDRNDPPMLHVHGALDDKVPIHQSELISLLQKRTGSRYAFWPIPGAGHGGPEFQNPPTINVVGSFLDEHLRGRVLQHPVFSPVATPGQGVSPLNVGFRSIFARAVIVPASPTWSFGTNSVGVGTSTQHTYEFTGEYPASVTYRYLENSVTTNTTAVRVFAPGSGASGTVRFHNDLRLIREVGTAVWLRVYRELGTEGTVSVGYRTIAGSAQAGLDFTPMQGRLTFAPGETVKVVKIPVIDDGLAENEERFSVVLENPDGGLVIGRPGTATIRLIDN